MTNHTISFQQAWENVSFRERLALEAGSALMWMLDFDQRITVLANLLADEIENEDQIDAITDALKQNLKLRAPLSS